MAGTTAAEFPTREPESGREEGVVTMHFAVGKRMCSLELHVDEDTWRRCARSSVLGEDDGVVGEFLEQVMAKEGVPEYAQNSLRASLHYLLEADELTYTPAVANLKDTLAGAQDWARALAARNHEWLELSKNSVGVDEDAVEKHEAEAFARAYHALVTRSQESMETLARLEKSFSLAVSGMVRSMKGKVARLQTKQSEEMAQACRRLEASGAAAEAQINELVQRHVVEMERLEGMWAEEIEHMKAGQRNDYWDFVMNSAVVYDGDETPRAGREDEQRAPQLLKGESGMSLSSGAGSGSSVPSGADAASHMDTAQELVHSLKGEEWLVAYVGSAQVKRRYELSIVEGGIADVALFAADDDGIEMAQRMEMARSMFCGRLSAMVTLIDPELEMSSPRCRDLLNLCGLSTEFHFNTIQEQLYSAARRLKCRDAASDTVTLQKGDVLPTRHSNLNMTQIIFHVVTDSKQSSAGDAAPALVAGESGMESTSPLLTGFMNVIRLANQTNVHTLTIPLPLTETEWKAVEQSTTVRASFLKNAEATLKCLRAALTQDDGRGLGRGSVLRVRFLVPKMARKESDVNEFFMNCRGMVKEIFHFL